MVGHFYCSGGKEAGANFFFYGILPVIYMYINIECTKSFKFRHSEFKLLVFLWQMAKLVIANLFKNKMR